MERTDPSSRRPLYRNLRGYAFDPSLSLLIDTAEINKIVYRINWEETGPGPSGEYIEVIDHDPASDTYYTPVDLNDKYILANDGLDPSETNPQFHQQMVYAVTMVTIQNFEKALGRKILWASRLNGYTNDNYEDRVDKLRIYPHAMREANAYYSPAKKAILFGYFSSSPSNSAKQMPGSMVFTCLSHDIIAHEVTHAILDGLHRNYNIPSNPDVLAFHEAFADIIALFQHFTFPEVLRHQIEKTRGDLEKQNLLGELAQQFGVAIGNYGSLRDAIGKHVDGKWVPIQPSPTDYQNTHEPHSRGSILVAAVFEAFLNIYKRRIRDLLRIATAGTGVLPEGDLHPDLVNRLAEEASKTADHVLSMCIRAIDYCPPVDITFGDYLRAIITADCDIVRDDKHYYRLAFVEAFRRRGIYPDGVKSLGIETLQYPKPWKDMQKESQKRLGFLLKFLGAYRDKLSYVKNRVDIYEKSKEFIVGGLLQHLDIKLERLEDFQALSGIVVKGGTAEKKWKQLGIRTSKRSNGPSYQIQNLRLVSRVGPDGDLIEQIVFSLIQRMGVKFDDYGKITGHFTPGSRIPTNGLIVYGGSTLIFDVNEESLCLKYAIAKPLFDASSSGENKKPNKSWIETQYQFQSETLPTHASPLTHYFAGDITDPNAFELFALLHHGEEDHA